MITGKAEIIRSSDALDAAEKAADIFSSAAMQSFESGKIFTVAFSGGKTPLPFFKVLLHRKLDWSRIAVFQVDERFVPQDSEDNNFRMLYENLLSQTGSPDSLIFRMKTEFPDPDSAAAEYEKHLKDFFAGVEPPVFDFIHLGMGDDGHTASLFPDSPLLDDTVKLISGTMPPEISKPAVRRITMTYKLINAARHRLFLVSGKAALGAKAAVLPELWKQRFPAAGIEKSNTTWVL